MFCLRTFCHDGRLVFRTFYPAADILSLRTFCPAGCYVLRRIFLQLLCRRTFCLSGRYVSGRFVWAPYSIIVVAKCGLCGTSYVLLAEK
jgi:hypothetical protein